MDSTAGASRYSRSCCFATPNFRQTKVPGNHHDHMELPWSVCFVRCSFAVCASVRARACACMCVCVCVCHDPKKDTAFLAEMASIAIAGHSPGHQTADRTSVESNPLVSNEGRRINRITSPVTMTTDRRSWPPTLRLDVGAWTDLPRGTTPWPSRQMLHNSWSCTAHGS